MAGFVVVAHGAGHTAHAWHVWLHVGHDGHVGHIGRKFCNPMRFAKAPNNLPVAGLESTVEIKM